MRAGLRLVLLAGSWQLMNRGILDCFRNTNIGSKRIQRRTIEFFARTDRVLPRDGAEQGKLAQDVRDDISHCHLKQKELPVKRSKLRRCWVEIPSRALFERRLAGLRRYGRRGLMPKDRNRKKLITSTGDGFGAR